MGFIDFTCQSCYHSWRGHMGFCPKCGVNPMKAPMSMEQILNAPYEAKDTVIKDKVRPASTMAHL